MNTNYSLIEQLQTEMKKAGWDIKAEPQLLLALEQGLLPDDFLVSCDGLFRREYSRDITDAILKEDSKMQDILELHLSRSGLYDQLPEGLFFQSPQKNNRVMNALDMAGDYKYNKKKEEEIRRFFLPFENDFFLQRLRLEEEEAMLLEGLRSGILNDYFIKFWNLPAEIPCSFIIPFILLLPYASRITGNLALTAASLQQLLQEEVQVFKKQPGLADAASLHVPAMGEGLLGVDMMCGVQFWDGTVFFELQIGPLQHSGITDYLEGGKRHVLLETFNRFFVPAGIDTVLTIKPAAAQLHMQLQEDGGPVLGYSSILG
jgi:Type VI secretion, TssG